MFKMKGFYKLGPDENDFGEYLPGSVIKVKILGVDEDTGFAIVVDDACEGSTFFFAKISDEQLPRKYSMKAEAWHFAAVEKYGSAPLQEHFLIAAPEASYVNFSL